MQGTLAVAQNRADESWYRTRDRIVSGSKKAKKLVCDIGYSAYDFSADTVETLWDAFVRPFILAYRSKRDGVDKTPRRIKMDENMDENQGAIQPQGQFPSSGPAQPDGADISGYVGSGGQEPQAQGGNPSGTGGLETIIGGIGSIMAPGVNIRGSYDAGDNYVFEVTRTGNPFAEFRDLYGDEISRTEEDMMLYLLANYKTMDQKDFNPDVIGLPNPMASLEDYTVVVDKSTGDVTVLNDRYQSLDKETGEVLTKDKSQVISDAMTRFFQDKMVKRIGSVDDYAGNPLEYVGLKMDQGPTRNVSYN